MTHQEVAGPQHLGARVVSEIGLQQVLLVPKPAVVEIDAGVRLRQADIVYMYGNPRSQSRQHLAIEELNVAAFSQRVRRIDEQNVAGLQRFEKPEVDFLDASLHELGEMGEPASYDRRGIRFYANQLRATGDSDIVSPAGFRSHYRRPARSHFDDPSRAKVSDQGVIEVRIHCHIGTVDQPKAVRILCWLFDRIGFSELGKIG